MRRNTLIRGVIYPAVALLGGGLLMLSWNARGDARAEALARQAFDEISLGLTRQAEVTARASTELRPGSALGWVALGEALGRTARGEVTADAAKRADARRAFERALECAAGDVRGAEFVAESATKAGVLDLAERVADELVTNHGPTPSRLWLRGRARWLIGVGTAADRSAGRADLREACRTATSDALPVQIGGLAMAFDDVDLVTQAAGRLMVLAPEEPEAPAFFGWVAEQRADIPEALRLYQSAVDLARERERLRPARVPERRIARRKFLAELLFRRGGLRFAEDRAAAVDDLDGAFELNAASSVVALLTAQARIAAGRAAPAADALEAAWRLAGSGSPLRAEVTAQVRAGEWALLPPSPFRDELHAAAQR